MTFVNGHKVAGFTPALSSLPPQDTHHTQGGDGLQSPWEDPPHWTWCYLSLIFVCLNRWLQVVRTS